MVEVRMMQSKPWEHNQIVMPTSIRIEACSLCQLRCVLCPRTKGETDEIIGKGALKFDDFKRMIDSNPHIRKVELGNFGEVFLNKELPDILRYAYEKNVVTTIDEGANLNDASDEAIESLVRYQTARVRCAIDGVTQQTYEQYRVGGNLQKVIANIQKINSFKAKYQSSKPVLIFQFVPFSHNEHEMHRAEILAKMLRMKIAFKLNFFSNALPVQNRDKIRRYIGYADRAEYLEKEHQHYMRHLCYEMWLSPQINWDGKLLGCSRNFWGVYADNVFGSNLTSCINNEKMTYTRAMLMGHKPLRDNMPCRKCGVYKSMLEYGNWITDSELYDIVHNMDDIRLQGCHEPVGSDASFPHS